MKKNKAVIVGATGQDSSYLSEFLLEKGYEVHGIIRRASSWNTERIEHLMDHPNFFLQYGDITDSGNIYNIIRKVQPDEIYNMAAMSHVGISFEIPNYTAQVDAIGTLSVLEAVRTCCPTAKVYQASTSELFGKVQEIPQKETTPFYPRSPYGVAKLYGYWIVKNYREAYNLFACNGILFNHSSPRRTPNFILRKITVGLSKIQKGEESVLKLGNLNSMRDIGFSNDYIKGMWMMLQQDDPDDFVLATGKAYEIREFVEKAAKHIDINIEWKGEGLNEKGYDQNGRVIIEVNPKYFRPLEVDLLVGDASKAKSVLGWEPETSIDDLIKMMMKNDLK